MLSYNKTQWKLNAIYIYQNVGGGASAGALHCDAVLSHVAMFKHVQSVSPIKETGIWRGPIVP